MRYRVTVPVQTEQTWLVDASSPVAAIGAVAEGHGVLECPCVVEPGDALSIEHWQVELLKEQEDEA